MEDIDLKNMVILKDLPSNIVKEAYVVFKSNKMIKKIQKIDRNSEKNQVKKENKDGSTSYDFWRVTYHDIDFDNLHEVKA